MSHLFEIGNQVRDRFCGGKRHGKVLDTRIMREGHLWALVQWSSNADENLYSAEWHLAVDLERCGLCTEVRPCE